MTRRILAAAAALLVLPVAAGCSDSGGSGAASPATELTVYAAASLRTTFTEIGEQFQDSHPGTTVTFNFAGSSDLVAQLQQGADADVFASADEANMVKVTDLMAGTPTTFATNTMQIAVPPDNPANVTSFASLAAPGVQVVVCAPQVPCGAATVRIERTTGVTLTPVSQEQSVSDVLGKVTSGQADAGVVYVTDVLAAGDAVTGITIPATDNAVNTYPIAVLADSAQRSLAEQFEAFVAGPQGQQVLAAAGFGAP